MTTEEFAERLRSALKTQHIQSKTGYVIAFQLDAAIAQALNPPGDDGVEYPRCLFFQNDRDNIRVVENHEAEAAALSEGYTLTFGPQFAEGFPKFYVETPQSQGGAKVWDNRRVTLLTPKEEQRFLAVVEIADWMEDGPDNQFGARGIGVDSLVLERREQLKAIIDAEVLEPAPAAVSADEPVMPAEDEASAEVMASPEVQAEESEVNHGN